MSSADWVRVGRVLRTRGRVGEFICEIDSSHPGRAERLQHVRLRADAALLQYKIANGLMSAEGATMAEQETSTLNQQIAQARATLAEREGRLSGGHRRRCK